MLCFPSSSVKLTIVQNYFLLILFFPVYAPYCWIPNSHSTQRASLHFESDFRIYRGENQIVHSFYSRQMALDRNFHWGTAHETTMDTVSSLNSKTKEFTGIMHKYPIIIHWDENPLLTFHTGRPSQPCLFWQISKTSSSLRKLWRLR